MHPRMVMTIFRKDLRDAIRDARVLVALILPLGIGIFYSQTFSDDTAAARLDATIVYASPDPTNLPDAIRVIDGEAVALTFTRVGSEQEVRNKIDGDDADLGLIVPTGFDDAVKTGQQPSLTVLVPANPSTAARVVVESLDPSVRHLSGEQAPAKLQIEQTLVTENQNLLDQIGLRTWSVIVAIVLMISMVSLLVVPVVLAEEAEKNTLDALVLIASHADVIAAKALLGIFYISVMVPLLLRIATIGIDSTLAFYGTVALLAVSLLGFGLLLGSLFRNANQLNTWAGIILVPVVAPAFAVGIPAPAIIRSSAAVSPTGQAMKLLINSATGEQLYHNVAISIAVICLWAVAAFALLLWDMRRRQA
ncbi:MAG: ABC transporter permease [Thermomicrobiales bacterium]